MENNDNDNENQAKKAYMQLEKMIVSLELEPGAKVSEKGLSERLGIGRTPIREALQRLAAEGTVSIVPRTGIIVSTIDVPEQFHLIEVRRGIERIISARSARLATPEERTQFSELVKLFRKAGAESDENLFILTDRDYNNLVAATSRNKYALRAMQPLQAQTRRFWYLYFKRFGDLSKVCELHARIAEAISNADEKAAEQASDDLLDYVEEYTTKTMKAIY